MSLILQVLQNSRLMTKSVVALWLIFSYGKAVVIRL